LTDVLAIRVPARHLIEEDVAGMHVVDYAGAAKTRCSMDMDMVFATPLVIRGTISISGALLLVNRANSVRKMICLTL
jgi:hypothetical protein